MYHVIYQTRGTVFHQILQTPRSGLKNEVQPSFFNPLQGVWIPDETLFRVFDITSQTDPKCRENEGMQSPKSMPIKTGYQNLLHGSDFLCVLVIGLRSIYKIILKHQGKETF